MLIYALKMMVGDRAKFLGILVGLTFATFIMTQQAGIFVGLMSRTFGFVTDTSQNDIWVVDRRVQQIDDIKPIKSTKLFQVRGIEGVQWAVPMFKGILRARLPSGVFQNCNIVGIDDSTLIGGPPRMVEGKIEDLRDEDAVIIDIVGAEGKLASPKGPMHVGEVFEINDRRARVAGFCRITRTFASQPVIYTAYERALAYSPSERNLMSFILVKSRPGVDAQELCKKISYITGLAAYTRADFKKLTVTYYLFNTGIPINFGIAVALGFIIGAAIAGQTFYTFAHDNLRYFAAYKAMGATNALLTKMVLIQAVMVATLGWGIGIGCTTLFGFTAGGSELSFTLPWWLLLTSGAAIYLITLFSALVSVAKIVRLDPSIVFAS